MIDQSKTVYCFIAEKSFEVDIPITGLYPGESYTEIPDESEEESENNTEEGGGT